MEGFFACWIHYFSEFAGTWTHSYAIWLIFWKESIVYGLKETMMRIIWNFPFSMKRKLLTFFASLWYLMKESLGNNFSINFYFSTKMRNIARFHFQSSRAVFELCEQLHLQHVFHRCFVAVHSIISNVIGKNFFSRLKRI